jgi:capsular exopolysaccharide synthesis family protein
MATATPAETLRVPEGPGRFERELDTRYYAELLWRSRLLLAAAAVGGLVLGVVAGEVQTPRFRARSLLEVMPPNPTGITVTDALVGTGNPMRDRQYFNTQLNVLRSRALGERVVNHLKLKDGPPFQGHPDPGGLFTRHVGVEAVPETFVVEVKVTHQDPAEAARWANALADLYVDYSIEGQVESARRAYQWVTERLAETQDNMREAQGKLLNSYDDQSLFVPEGSVSAITTSITKLNEDHVQAQARRIAVQAELADFTAMQKRGRDLDAAPRVAADATVRELNSRLQALSLDLSRLKEKYKAGHPEVQKVQVQLDLLQKAKDTRIQQIEEGLRAEHRQLERREAELKQAVEAHRSRAVDETRKLTALDSLKKQADSATGLYAVLLQKLNETNIAASLHNNNVRLLDRAIVPSSPIYPERKKLALLGLLLGVVLGAGYLLLRDYFANTIKDGDDVERYLHLDLLAAVPKHTKENAPLATEAYQTLRTALLFARRGELGQVVLVSGTAPGEGKTTTVVNLARLLAVSGEPTLVIDCDLRRANLHHRAGLAREPGLTDFFVKQAALSDLIQPTKLKNLFALTAGPLPPNPPALLARGDVGEFFAQLRRHYRWVVVDSPPLASVTDALLLARHADTTLLVIQHDKVDKKVVKRCLLALQRAAGNVLGGVLNAVDTRGRSHYYYYPQHAPEPSPAGGPGRAETTAGDVTDAPLVS